MSYEAKDKRGFRFLIATQPKYMIVLEEEEEEEKRTMAGVRAGKNISRQVDRQKDRQTEMNGLKE